MSFTGRAVATVAVLGAIAAGQTGAGTGRAEHALAVRGADGWVTWWRRDLAPIHWGDEAPLAERVPWQSGKGGLEWGEIQLRGANEAWRTRVVVVRLDPRRVDLSLVTAFTRNESWSVTEADSGAVLALDAGQFRRSLPWGWVVSEGRELLAPEYAPLAGAVIVDSSGRVRVAEPNSVALERERGIAREAFQSYPMLLLDGEIPEPLRAGGQGIDLEHRDARLALGTLQDGRVIVALTRFDALGESLGRMPFGLTSPEMAAVMGALGCRQALLLDGGISGQLAVRDSDGSMRTWSGTRRVPLGLTARPTRAR
ncbi:MAG TPA: phosphodiester glycosidase family protein [Gemmatimonadales bacterium]|nr:phosphodiester glycosidase family protein [Gemmatimonadales bacterium]